MIKHLRVTVDGHSYYVTVELADDPVAVPPPSGAPDAPVPNPAPTRQAAPAATAAPKAAASPAPAPAAPGPTGPGDVPSPLAGWVVGVDVTSGQEVKQGDKLLTLEAMKMNTFVNAPVSGQVAELLVAVGAAVEQGQILLRIR